MRKEKRSLYIISGSGMMYICSKVDKNSSGKLVLFSKIICTDENHFYDF